MKDSFGCNMCRLRQQQDLMSSICRWLIEFKTSIKIEYRDLFPYSSKIIIDCCIPVSRTHYLSSSLFLSSPFFYPSLSLCVCLYLPLSLPLSALYLPPIFLESDRSIWIVSYNLDKQEKQEFVLYGKNCTPNVLVRASRHCHYTYLNSLNDPIFYQFFMINTTCLPSCDVLNFY